MEWGKQLSAHDHPDRPPLTLVEAMGLGTLLYLGVPPEGLDIVLYWRRRVRAGQINGIGTEPRQERLRWQD